MNFSHNIDDLSPNLVSENQHAHIFELAVILVRKS